MSCSDGRLREAEVYFAGVPLNDDKIKSVLDRLDLSFVREGKLIGIKLHWGEENNKTYLPPSIFRPIIDEIKRRGGIPFLTDSLTLYSGKRREAVSAINLAREHGFDFPDAPIIIADGLRGENTFKYRISCKHFGELDLCGILKEADGFVVVSHFKGHIESGFGGALKNLSMGFASRRLKQLIHAEVKPSLKEEKCTGCGRCASICPVSAIRLLGGLPVFNLNICIGCASCIAICPVDALKFIWRHNPVDFLERLIESAKGVFDHISGRTVFLNFLVNITPQCDCMPYEQEIIFEDIGVFGSNDPVAIDALSLELVNNGTPRKTSSIFQKLINAENKIKAIYPDIPFEKQIEYAEHLGIGSACAKRIDIK